MEKLTLQDIAGYLPFNLELMINYNNKKKVIEPFDYGWVRKDGSMHSIIQPVLYPKSHLHQLQDEMIEDFYLHELPSEHKAKAIKSLTDNMLYRDYETLPFNNILFMQKHHIDYAGLIERGLAIDKNQIK